MSVILAQTDTTVGFLSQNAHELSYVKGREGDKPFLKVFASFKLLQENVRVPLMHRQRIRHARRTTFVIKNQALRYVGNTPHANLVAKYGWLYSTSANESTKHYDADFCFRHSDMIIEDSQGLFESSPSKILKLTSTRFKKLR